MLIDAMIILRQSLQPIDLHVV